MRSVLIAFLFLVFTSSCCVHADRHLRQDKLSHLSKLDAVQALRTEDFGATGQSPTTTTTNESWFERMKNAFTEFIIGLVLIAFSIPVLWFNESRSAQMESLLSYARSHCKSVAGKAAEEDNRYTLVHLNGESTKAVGQVNDEAFNVGFNSGCVKLARQVDVFQWVQHESKEEKEKLGGGKETITTYTYTQEWSGSWNDSNAFQDTSYRGRNKRPEQLELGHKCAVAGAVDYGEGYALSGALIDQLQNFQSASGKIGKTATLKASGKSFIKSEADDYYFLSANGTSQSHNPENGDARVNFTYVADGPATILALQAPGKTKESFLPYRLIDRGWCGISESEEKRLLKEQGEKSASELSDEAGCGGCLGCLCCACNLVAKCCSGIMTPEIHDIFTGDYSQSECFNMVTAKANATTWLIRLGGWLMMFMGLYMLFSPFLMLIRVLPFIGPYLSSFGGMLIWILCLITTLLLASVIIIVAYLFFHPMKAMLYALGTAVLVGGIVFLSHQLAAAP